MTFAKIAMKDANATPIMSAAAVAAVRAGSLAALSAASLPDTPEKRRIGHESTATSTGTSRLASAAIEPNSPIVPTAIRSRRAPTLPGSPRVPTESAEAARASAERPATSERRRGSLRDATDSRRLTAGATRPARAAGTSAAISVMTMPTARPGRSVPGVSAMGTSGIVRPIALNSAISPAPSATPRPVPMSEATVPITRPSARTETSAWRRLAPRQRSSASSRTRWATVIANVL